MGQLALNATFLAKAMPLTAANSGTPNALPAWYFQNQSGILGTYLDSSAIYCGVMPADASISVILPGINLASVSALSLSAAGTGYATAAGLATTTTNNVASGLTVDVTAAGAITVITVNAAGSGYRVGDIITVVQGGGANGTAEITAINDGVPVIGQAITFVGLQSGTILPVAVDYVTAVAGTGVTVLDFLIGR